MCYNAFIGTARFFPALLAMRARHAVPLTPTISLRLNQALSCTQIMRETPLIPFYVFKRLRTLLTIQRRMVILRNAVTKGPPALAAHYYQLNPLECAVTKTAGCVP